MGGTDLRAAKPRIQSIGRGFSVLFAIARSDRGLKARDIAAQLHLDRQTTYHILQSLEAMGVVTKSRENSYVLGLRVAELLEGFPRHLAPPERLAPLVRALVKEIGESSYVVGWVNDEIVVLATARGTKPVSAIDVPQGYTSNVHARASGKLLLALTDPARRSSYLDKRGLKKLTPKTITKRSVLEKVLAQIRASRLSIEREEFTAGLCCMAVPIADTGDTYVLGISVPLEGFDMNVESYKLAMHRVASQRSEY